jgi:hypothetical protein
MLRLALSAWVCLVALSGCATGPEPLSPEALQRAVPSLEPQAALVAPEFAVAAPAPAAMPAIPERVSRPEIPPEIPPEASIPRSAERVPEVPGFIIRDRVNLRPCPEEHDGCGPVAELRLNEEVRVIGEDGGWLRVAVPRVHRVGYVARRFVGPRRVPSPTPASHRNEPTAAQAVTPAKPRGEGNAGAQIPTTNRRGQDAGGRGGEMPPPLEELIQ